MKRNTIFSIGILIAFFLPWIDLTFFTLSGYNIPTSLDKINNVSKVFNSNDNSDILKISYFLYLIPICSAFNIIKDISGYKGSYFLNEFLFGIIGVILLFIMVNNINEKATSVFSIGYYLTALFSVLGIFSYNSNKSEEIQSPQKKEEPKEAVSISADKTDLLNQLSQLHSLKEKGVLTEEIYEQQRQEILSKLQTQNVSHNIIEPEAEAEPQPQQNISTLEEYDPEYEEIFGKETWFKRNKTWFITSIIIAILSIGSYFLYEASKTSEEKIVGLWSVKFYEVPLDSLNEKEKEDFLDFRKKVISMYYDFKQDSTLNCEIRFIDKDKNQNQKSDGTYNFSADKTKLKIHLNTDISPGEFEILSLSNKEMLLKINNIVLPLKKL